MHEPDRPQLESLRRLPKVLLHEHLDGGLSHRTLLRLLRARGIEPPAPDEPGVARWFAERANAGSLVEYLKGFSLTIAAMAEPEAMTQVAFEAAEEARRQGCVLAEFRMGPLLLESGEVSAEAAIEAMLEGLGQSALPSGLILCALRHEPAERCERVARLAARYLGQGVLGFDLAGAERDHPPRDFAGALALAREAGVPITLHAGEADAAQRVLEAADLGATRIGHGVRLVDWMDNAEGRERLAEVRERGLHLEMCPTSNVNTGAVPSLAEHPIAALWRTGISLSYHTDNPLMSCTTMTAEAAVLIEQQGLGRADLLAMAREAAKHSFLPEAVRAQALARLGDEAGRH
jgi:adenosine deaminase